MKRPTHYLTFILCSLLVMACGKGGRNAGATQRLGNTPYQEDSILMTYGSDPDRALTLLDSALLLGNISDYRAQFIKARIYSTAFAEQQKLDSATIIAEALLAHDSVTSNNTERINILDLLISANRLRRDDERHLRWSREKAKILRRSGNDTEYWRTTAEIGVVTIHMGQQAKGAALLDSAVAHLDRPGSINRMDAFVLAAKRKINTLLDQNPPKTTEAVAMAQRIIDRLNHYEQHSSDYADDSFRLPWSKYPEDRDRYLDFNRAQAYSFMAQAYAMAGDQDEKARECLERFREYKKSKSLNARYMITPVLIKLGLYDEAEQTLLDVRQQMGTDTVNDDFACLLFYSAKIAHARGNADRAYQLMVRHANIAKQQVDSMRRRDVLKDAANYQAQEARIKQAHETIAQRRNSVIWWGCLVVLVLMGTFAYAIYYQRRLINQKNTVLVKQMDEAVTRERTQSDALLPTADSMTNEELYQWLREGIRSQQLFLDPELDRSRIADAFRITERRVGAAFSQGSNYNSLPDFIRDCRLEYSCKLLTERPEMNIKEVAAASGFTYASTYSTDFKNRYTVTPTKYRELQAAKPKA